MKLYRINRDRSRDPLQVDSGPTRKQLVEETIELFSEVLADIIQRNNIRGLYISRCRARGATQQFKSHQTVGIANILHLVRLNVTDEMYTKIRDGSCRFIDFGQDYLVNVCLQHEDEIKTDGWHEQGIVIQDMSRLLIETDAYDL